MITKAIELGEAIQKNQHYLALEGAKQVNDNDEALQTLMRTFGTLRGDLDRENQQENPDPTKLEDLDRQVNELYENIMQNPNMQNYVSAQNALQEELEKVNRIIDAAINGFLPESGLSEGGGCGGGCDTCGGCN